MECSPYNLNLMYPDFQMTGLCKVSCLWEGPYTMWQNKSGTWEWIKLTCQWKEGLKTVNCHQEEVGYQQEASTSSCCHKLTRLVWKGKKDMVI
jgi:hypothetical protein